jgi:hypothetical protein
MLFQQGLRRFEIFNKTHAASARSLSQSMLFQQGLRQFKTFDRSYAASARALLNKQLNDGTHSVSVKICDIK